MHLNLNGVKLTAAAAATNYNNNKEEDLLTGKST